MLWATISLPVPLSPVTSTFASERATRSISCRRPAISWLLPISRTALLGVELVLTRGISSSARRVSRTFETPAIDVFSRRAHDGFVVGTASLSAGTAHGCRAAGFEAERLPEPGTYDRHIFARRAGQQHADFTCRTPRQPDRIRATVHECRSPSFEGGPVAICFRVRQ